jgi:hypothetical protein
LLIRELETENLQLKGLETPSGVLPLTLAMTIFSRPKRFKGWTAGKVVSRAAPDQGLSCE